MRHVTGIVIAVVAFAAGTGSVRAVDYAIRELWPVGETVSSPAGDTPDYEIGEVISSPIDLRVNGVRIDMSEARMIKLLGKPQAVDRDRRSREYKYPGLSIEFDEYHGTWTVNSIDVTSGAWNISGVSLGSSVYDVEHKFGVPVADNPQSLIYYDTSGIEVDFMIKDGRVVEVSVAYDDC